MGLSRHTIYGNVARIDEPQMVQVPKYGRDGKPTEEKVNKQVVNLILAVNSTGGKAEEPATFYQGSFWGEDAERLMVQEVAIGDYVMIDLHNIKASAYEKKAREGEPAPEKPELAAIIKGTGTFSYLVSRKRQPELEADAA
jgi:hypothetical protein